MAEVLPVAFLESSTFSVLLLVVKDRNILLLTLIVPWWPSAPFWPSLFQASNLTQKYVHKILMFSDTSGLLKQGNFKISLLGSERFFSPLGAFRISAAE